jgi:hypothetical protein
MTDEDLRDALDEARGALERAKAQFYRYAQLHRAKATDEGDEKACTNASYGEDMAAAIERIVAAQVAATLADIDGPLPTNEINPLRIGDRVQVVATERKPWTFDWQNIGPLYVAGMRMRRGVLDIELSEQWPPEPGATDGFAVDDLFATLELEAAGSGDAAARRARVAGGGGAAA